MIVKRRERVKVRNLGSLSSPSRSSSDRDLKAMNVSYTSKHMAQFERLLHFLTSSFYLKLLTSGGVGRFLI